MNQDVPHPLLLFDFADGIGNRRRRVFSDPVDVITANTIEDVSQALKRIRQYVKEGYYAAGMLSYEAAPAFDSGHVKSQDASLPLLWFGIFLQASGDVSTTARSGYRISPWVSDTSAHEHACAIQAIKEAILRGDSYQVNYTMRLHAQFEGDDLQYYHELCRLQQADYTAYANIGTHSILSISPELFFQLHGDTVTTRPMKGTVARGRWLEEDMKRAAWLSQSAKDRTENVMIVDLLRNDLSKIDGVSNVHVSDLCVVERYPTVYQMTSTVMAHIAADRDAIDVLAALFPCGSITGAPKISTMKIISQLEKSPRGVYCGTMGFIQPDGDAVFNVAIRTVVIDRETGIAQYGVGGGVTWDSTPKDEHAEALAKAAFLHASDRGFELLETMLFDGHQYVLMERHLERLCSSAQYFDFHVDLAVIKSHLDRQVRENDGRQRRIRLRVTADGTVLLESEELVPLAEGPQRVQFAKTPISSHDRFLYHKTTHREVYQTHQAANPDVFDVLLWNERGQVTEFTNGNLILELEDQLVTPARDCGLLAGTFRASLLDEGSIVERTLTISDVRKARRVWFVNSVRGWVPVVFVDQLRIDEVTEWTTEVLDSLCSLLVTVVGDGASIGFLPPLGLAEALRYWECLFESGIRLWVARYDGEIVGTVQLHLSMKQNGAHRAEIAKLMVHPQRRRLGIARQLMDVAERAALEAKRSLLVLDTRAGDPSNVLYRSLGFVEAGRIPGYARSADGQLHDTIIYYKVVAGSHVTGNGPV